MDKRLKEIVLPNKEISDAFFEISYSERKMVREWFTKQNPKTEREKKFLKILSKAMDTVKYDYEIATMEPTVFGGKIEYIEGRDVAVGYSANQWKQMAKEYLPEKGSRLATLYELFIWYAWRIVQGYWTLNFATNDSSYFADCTGVPNTTSTIERAGKRTFAGFRDGQGNTYKLVTYKDRLVGVGGCFNCDINFYPASYILCNFDPNDVHYNGCGVLVLTK